MNKFQEKYEDFLAHYGVPGMEWGSDKKAKAAANAATATRNARRRRLARQAENASYTSSKSVASSHTADKYYGPDLRRNAGNIKIGTKPITDTHVHAGAFRNDMRAALERNRDRKAVSDMAAEIMRKAKSKKQAGSSSSSPKSSASQEYLREREANSKKNRYFGR